MAKNENRYKGSILAGIDLFDDDAKKEALVSEAKPAAAIREEMSAAIKESFPTQYGSPVPTSGRQPVPAEERSKQVRSFRTCVNLTQDLRDRARAAQESGLFYSLNNTFNVLLDQYLKEHGF